LDFSRKDVREHIYSKIKKALASASIEYVKWDMNRSMAEIGSAAPSRCMGEISHRYILGVYELMGRLLADFPHILLETCAGGGGRFDPGMLYYSPQIWTSDNTDPIARLRIQAGASIAYPVCAMGAHVSDSPNHITGRRTPFTTRGHAALCGAFGYELDVSKLSEEDKALIPVQIAEHRKYSSLAANGDYYRIGGVFRDSSWCAWIIVSKDKSEALFTYAQILADSNTPAKRVKLKGLNEEFLYEDEESKNVLSGAALMYVGIDVKLFGDFSSRIIHLRKKDDS
jgi:alpha-galactosidase